jgi:LacI family gluconate utilization system Gnt-I transcriptional repressor
MAEAILAAGYRRIGFMGTKMALDHRARKRYEGFVEALAKNGVELADWEFYEGGSALAKGRELTAAMLERTPDLDFLYYSNDLIGAGGLLLAQERGLDIPGSFGMAGFNGVELLQGLPTQLATIDSCRKEIGRQAARMIMARADGALPPETVTLTPKLNPGATMRTA